MRERDNLYMSRPEPVVQQSHNLLPAIMMIPVMIIVGLYLGNFDFNGLLWTAVQEVRYFGVPI